MLQRPSNFTLDPSHPLSKGLVGAYIGRVVNNTGVRDASINIQRNLSAPDGWVWSQTLGRYAIDVQTTGVEAEADDDSHAAFNALTLAAWVKTDTTVNVDRQIIAKCAGGNATNIVYWLMGDITNQVQFILSNGTGVTTLSTSNDIITNGTWTHVVGRWDGTNAEIFVNGNQQAGPTAFSSLNSAAKRLRVGAERTVTSELWDGAIADPLIYQRALTLAEIRTLANRYDPFYDNWIIPTTRRVFAVKTPAAPTGNQPLYTTGMWYRAAGARCHARAAATPLHARAAATPLHYTPPREGRR